MQMYSKTTDLLWIFFLPWNYQNKYETIFKSQKEKITNCHSEVPVQSDAKQPCKNLLQYLVKGNFKEPNA